MAKALLAAGASPNAQAANRDTPWLLAGAVLAFLIAEHRRTTAALLDANTRLSEAVEQQGKALDGVRALLASQGYTLPPLTRPQ